MSTSQKVAYRIRRMNKGVPFSINRLRDLGTHAAVQKALSRLEKQGVIERVYKGIYSRPERLMTAPTVSVTASPKDVAREWAKTRGYTLVEQGHEASYRLGFQTQMPVRTIYWSNGPTRRFSVGNASVEVRHVADSKLRWKERPEGQLLRALLVLSPESVGATEFKRAISRLNLSESEARKVVKRLKSSSLRKSWKSKLEEFERNLFLD